jgi:histidinol-phosphate aminotransferase
MNDIRSLFRENIRNLVPYSSARDEYKGEEAVFLDANENPYNQPFNRYPDPLQVKLKQRISIIKGVLPEQIFLGNGSDEAIDLLYRAFCEPGKDNVVSIKPTYGMYKVCADVNNVEYRESMLTGDFQVNTTELLSLSDARTKLMFLCTPNNPTSNSLEAKDILFLVEKFNGLVVVDEAYIDFSTPPTLLTRLLQYKNLVILQTFSKAWGMAGIRLGMAFADPLIISTMNRIKYPYNVNILTQKTALDHLQDISQRDKWVRQILEQRTFLENELAKLRIVTAIFPSDANFLMVKFKDPASAFRYLMERKIIVRDRSKVPMCEGCLRITVGSPEENKALISALNTFQKESA